MAVVSSLTLFIGLGSPAQPIWDESYYLTSTQRYLERTAQFASHPPLGLMLIAAGAALSDDKRGVDAHQLAATKAIAGADVPQDYNYVRVRLASAVFGVIGAALFFQLMLSLTGRIATAMLLSNLYIFENAFVTQFRAGHLDAFQMVFVLMALQLFLRGVMRETSRASETFTLGVACGLAAMVRLNGVFLIPLGALLVTHRLWRARGQALAWARTGRDGLIMTAGFVLAVTAVMTVHVVVSRHPPNLATPAGQRDAGFISPTYRAYLDGERTLSPKVVLAAATDYRRYIAADFDGMTREDANGSSPIVWPLLGGSINYRWDSDGVTTRYLQLAGNQVGWAISLAGLIAATALVFTRSWTDQRRRALVGMLLVGYAGFLAMNIALGQHRVMYLYHYFPGLLLGFLLAAISLTEARARWPDMAGWRSGLMIIAGLHLVCFAFEAPLTYHRPLSHAACENRNWGQTIVACR